MQNVPWTANDVLLLMGEIMNPVQKALERVSHDGSVKVGIYWDEAKVLAAEVMNLRAEVKACDARAARFDEQRDAVAFQLKAANRLLALGNVQELVEFLKKLAALPPSVECGRCGDCAAGHFRFQARAVLAAALAGVEGK